MSKSMKPVSWISTTRLGSTVSQIKLVKWSISLSIKGINYLSEFCQGILFIYFNKSYLFSVKMSSRSPFLYMWSLGNVSMFSSAHRSRLESSTQFTSANVMTSLLELNVNAEIDIDWLSIYLYKVVSSVCLSGCPIITQKSLDRLALNFDRETQENTGMFFAWFWHSKLSWGKIAKIVIYDQARVNGGGNFVPWATLGSHGYINKFLFMI